MQVTITNNGPVALPVSSTGGGGFANAIEPGEAFDVADTAAIVVNVGDNPTFLEEFEEGLEALGQVLLGFITFWREHQREAAQEHPTVEVSLHNHGLNALRVLLGSNLDAVEVVPGEVYTATALRYVEIRELGV